MNKSYIFCKPYKPVAIEKQYVNLYCDSRPTELIVLSREKTCGGWVGKETPERQNKNPADMIQLWSKRDLDTVVGEMQLKNYWTFKLVPTQQEYCVHIIKYSFKTIF